MLRLSRCRISEFLYFSGCVFTDNHDIISMKFYEIDVPVSDGKKEEDRSQIVPFASAAEPFRGMCSKISIYERKKERGYILSCFVSF